MRTLLRPSSTASRSEWVAILLPEGSSPPVLPGAPDPATWRADLKKEGASLVLRGKAGRRWWLFCLPRKPDHEDLRVAAGEARLAAEAAERAGLTVDLSSLKNDPALVQAVAEGAGMASYDPGVLQAKREKSKVKRITICGAGASRGVRLAVKVGSLAAAASLAARDISNLPSNILSPKEFARRTRRMVAGSPRIRCRVHGEKKMREWKMESLLGVSRGSRKEAQLIHLVYKPKGKATGKVAVVGKGLCFDSGGISLKPSGNMWDMKFDMCGAAAVFGLFHALAGGLPCKTEIHGILACVENMPGGNAQNPGDIVRAMNGTTIEVLNTDAEGRLVLADALTWTARKIKPDSMIDLATLTGAAIIALGHTASAVLGNDDALLERARQAGDACGERVWPLPLWDVHKKLCKGTYADLQNIYDAGQGAGTVAAAAFLSHFVEDVPWLHVDIAATAWEGPSKPYYRKGARASGVRLLVEMLRS